LIDRHAARGVTELYPPQAACVEQGLLDGRNLLVAIPTASGKTLVAELAMHSAIASGGKCLYIVPLRALAAEKYSDFSSSGARVGIATGDFDRRDDFLGRNEIIVATSEKVDSLLRNRTPWLAQVTLLVVDEVHMVGSPDRGATLELVIAKLRRLNPGLQLIGLSATIGNPATLAEWLGAALVASDWRPVVLRQGVYYRGKIRFHDGCRELDATASKSDDLNLCLDTIAEGGQCLVFVNSRRNAEGFAKRAASAIRSKDPALAEYARRITALAATELDRTLAACVSRGAAFHHAGLRREYRDLVEEGFRTGVIKCISSTPTLAAGLNLPARRVVVRDCFRFSGGQGMVPIPVQEYHQMAGRAGRPHLDPYGEAVLIAKSEETVDELFERYIDAPPEPIASRCGDPGVLCTHILSLIATRFARTEEDLGVFMATTFYGHTHHDAAGLAPAIESALLFLLDAEMITDLSGRYEATEYGSLVSRLYVDPVTAEQITHALLEAEAYSDVGLLQVLCATPDMPSLFVKARDMDALTRFAYEREDDLWLEFPWDSQETFYRALKTALLLSDYVAEATEETICERYEVAPGDIHSAVTNIAWLVHAATRLAAMFRPEYERNAAELELCVAHGVRRELLPLIRLRGIGRVRARRLFTNGITDPDSLRAAGRDAVAKIIGGGIADQVFTQFEKGRNADEVDEGRPQQTSLLQFG
jgi:helicase